MFRRAKLLSYDSHNKTAKIHIYGLTDGLSAGLEASFMYPVGDDDRDTERLIKEGSDVFFFFEAGDEGSPVICGYSSHSNGIEGTRRIRQRNIELLAEKNFLLDAKEISMTSQSFNVTSKGDIHIKSDANIILEAKQVVIINEKG